MPRYGAAAYLFAVVGCLLLIRDVFVADPFQQIAVLKENQTFLYILTLITYNVFGVFLVILALALFERLKRNSHALVLTATAIGLIWACRVIASGVIVNYVMGTVVDLIGADPNLAATSMLVIDSGANGLGVGEDEILGDTWILLVKWTTLRAREFPNVLNYFGMLIGLVGFITVVPSLGELPGLIFCLSQIVWFVWLGSVMLRSSPSTAEQKTEAFVGAS